MFSLAQVPRVPLKHQVPAVLQEHQVPAVVVVAPVQQEKSGHLGGRDHVGLRGRAQV